MLIVVFPANSTYYYFIPATSATWWLYLQTGLVTYTLQIPVVTEACRIWLISYDLQYLHSSKNQQPLCEFPVSVASTKTFRFAIDVNLSVNYFVIECQPINKILKSTLRGGNLILPNHHINWCVIIDRTILCSQDRMLSLHPDRMPRDLVVPATVSAQNPRASTTETRLEFSSNFPHSS